MPLKEYWDVALRGARVPRTLDYMMLNIHMTNPPAAEVIFLPP